MNTLRQTFFGAFEEYFNSGMGSRSRPVTFQHAFFSEAPGGIQEGLQCLTRGIVPASVDNAKAGEIEPYRQGSEPVEGILVGRRVLLNLAKKFAVLVRILHRMNPQKPAVLILGRPPDRVEFVISHYRRCCAGFTHGARNSQDLPLLRATIYEIANEDHLSFWMPENTFDRGVVEFA